MNLLSQATQAKNFTDQLAKYIKKANKNLSNNKCGIANIQYGTGANGEESISISFWSENPIINGFVCKATIDR